MSKNGQKMKKEAYRRAYKDVYAQYNPKPIDEVENPFIGKQAKFYNRFYEQIREKWYWLESL